VAGADGRGGDNIIFDGPNKPEDARPEVKWKAVEIDLGRRGWNAPEEGDLLHPRRL
jgi:hypothetical protein